MYFSNFQEACPSCDRTNATHNEDGGMGLSTSEALFGKFVVWGNEFKDLLLQLFCFCVAVIFNFIRICYPSNFPAYVYVSPPEPKKTLILL